MSVQCGTQTRFIQMDLLESRYVRSSSEHTLAESSQSTGRSKSSEAGLLSQNTRLQRFFGHQPAETLLTPRDRGETD